MERTLIIFKPDAVQRGLVGKILARFEERGLQIAGMKMEQLNDDMLQEHYAHLRDKPFFAKLTRFMKSVPVVLAVLEGVEAVDIARKMCGVTNSREALPGTIRGDYGMSVQSNVIHASDSKETAKKEVARFFAAKELFHYERADFHTVYAEDERNK